MKDETELLSVQMTPELKYQYTAGRYGSIFLHGLKEAKFYASECASCGTVQAPPRIICGTCWKETKNIKEVGPSGQIMAFTQVTLPFIDPLTGETRPVPYCYGMIQLDGTQNTFQHFLEETEIENVYKGMRVRAVFKKERSGHLSDILHFTTLDKSKRKLSFELPVLDSNLAPLHANQSVKPFMALFNACAAVENFEKVLALFEEDAEMFFRLIGKKHFKGKARIGQALGGLPKKAQMLFLSEISHGDLTVAKFQLKGLPLPIKGTLYARFNAGSRIVTLILAS